MDNVKHLENLTKWYEADKKHSLRYNYPLNTNSIVLDLGAYNGDWAAEIHKRYNCSVYCFEPVLSLYNKLEERFRHNNKIKTYNFAIGDSNRDDIIFVNKDGSSMFNKTDTTETIKIKSIIDVLIDLNFEKVDLIKMNIEGSEFEIFELLIKENKLSIFDHLQIQFHRDVNNFAVRRDKIREKLAMTHNEKYNFEFIWESWSIL